MRFEPIAPRDIEGSVFDRIAKEWMLVTAGGLSSWNTMTASWGGFGHVWNQDVAFVFVRPSRHTYGFIERSGSFTLSFFGKGERAALATCGGVSGRDADKAALTGLRPFELEQGAVSFEQAELVLACTALYKDDLDPARFLDPGIEEHYHGADYHRLYIARIDAALRRSE